MDISDSTRIRELNDAFRKNFSLGCAVLSVGVAALGPDKVETLVRLVAAYDDFNPSNDPYGEGDFGAIELEGQRFFFKIDYFDKRLEFHSPDPSDPQVTTRVLTLMLASEY